MAKQFKRGDMVRSKYGEVMIILSKVRNGHNMYRVNIIQDTFGNPYKDEHLTMPVELVVEEYTVLSDLEKALI